MAGHSQQAKPLANCGWKKTSASLPISWSHAKHSHAERVLRMFISRSSGLFRESKDRIRKGLMRNGNTHYADTTRCGAGRQIHFLCKYVIKVPTAPMQCISHVLYDQFGRADTEREDATQCQRRILLNCQAGFMPMQKQQSTPFSTHFLSQLI